MKKMQMKYDMIIDDNKTITPFHIVDNKTI